MARARNTFEDTEPPVEPITEDITYTPGPMDPVMVKWCGHTFQANVAKTITGHAEGTPSQKLNHQMIESARDNRHFQVGATKKKRDASALPTTADGYKGYMIDWIKDPTIQHADELVARFARDRQLQAACEVGSDDFSYLATLFMPRLHELAHGDELTDLQVSSLWASHGINVLPW